MGRQEDRPKGRELKVCRDFERLVKSIHKMAGDFEILLPTFKAHDLDINMSHVLEGVRTNGHQRAVTALDVYRGIKEFSEATDRARRKLTAYATQAGNIRKQAEVAFAGFSICPSCRGAKGSMRMRGGGATMTQAHGEWFDCDRCEGRGIVEKVLDGASK